ncbi:MAG: alanine--glyoxylate aminotransferase family protein [Candidatus Methanoliparum thermophilum]|uniref:Alanine--glyoxylate aminotransferase family protein n=1 Tax=Methanoliparum thermophilum TaxID=2491083 RepID=A0A520KTE2_METT2|nr:alanine--glyoxylate aminotransferase family protein [Candidatus Methanoliparum sp. LAM-1]RZN64835.1 MAG: alanine--glyoxylate aminotransferase family protein [Candidatus Methanoliparum thermophilum]BDC36294.1 alanine--glyoxylate aminotransferase family protein [Candidatus Methanoliparum sp. LAM-1]
MEKETIMLPGPVAINPRVLEAMSRPIINHRGEKFGEILEYSTQGLKKVFKTKNDLFILSGSGTSAMESALGNLLNKDDKILAIVNGKFGERFSEIGSIYGNCISLNYEWGDSVNLENIKEVFEENEDIKVVTLVHNETSTGIINPAKEVSKIAKDNGAVFVMDGVSSIGGNYVNVDDWGVDIAILGSQKCLAAPPGLAMISVSDDAWDMIEKTKHRPYYTDLKAYRKSLNKKPPQTPYTPAVSLFFALEEAIKIFLEEGIENIILRYKKYSDAIREAIKSLGLELFPKLNEYSNYSNTVNAIRLPEGINETDLKKGMKDRGIVISGGQERLKNKIFRIGTMGYLSSQDIINAISALEFVLKSLKCDISIGSGVSRANDILFN